MLSFRFLFIYLLTYYPRGEVLRSVVFVRWLVGWFVH